MTVANQDERLRVKLLLRVQRVVFVGQPIYYSCSYCNAISTRGGRSLAAPAGQREQWVAMYFTLDSSIFVNRSLTPTLHSKALEWPTLFGHVVRSV
jgi:hypothetical protein